MSDSDRAVWVCERLDEQWGKLTWHSHGEPLDALVQIILSQHTSDVLSDRAFDALRRRFPGGWDEVRMAPVEDIRGAISCGGLAEVKAPRIKAILQSLFDATGETDLGFLRAMPTPEIQAFLLSFHGVGPKTAACVLMFSLGRPVLPVDTHVFRVSHRIGLINQKIGEARAHDALQAQLPDDRIYAFHVHLIRHGRRVCTARAPRCEECVLRERCDFYHERVAGGAPRSTPLKTLTQKPVVGTLHGLKTGKDS